MGIPKLTAFEVLFATMQFMSKERADIKGWAVPDHDFDFEELRRLKEDPKFSEKTASVINYLLAQILMKMGFNQVDIYNGLSEIIEEQMFLIDSTMHEYPSGPLRHIRTKEKRK